MAANAPYYQMRAGQFINAANGTNAVPPQFAPEDDEYDLSTAAAAASPLDHLHSSMYNELSARQASADNSFEESHNLAELLEAATTAQAAGQPAGAMNADNAVTAQQGKGKRKRVSSSPAAEAAVTYQADEAFGGKRRRVDVPTDPQLQDGDRSIYGASGHTNVSRSNESLLSDARAAGVHSAAALFRRSSERSSRKYTRPPMSKLFMSLQLSPENFLHLQAQAKTYMLDSTHPERQNCVGNRGKGDTDMVKLRLFNCVRDFLDDGVGEHFFGEHVEKPGEREAIEAARALGEEKMSVSEARLTWPRDGNKIIGLVTPLMRRMVTNERQRQYAIETRKGGTKKKEGDESVETTVQQAHNIEGQGMEQQLQSAFDPNLVQPSQPLQPPSPSASIDTMDKFNSLPGRYRRHSDRDRTTLTEAEAKASESAGVKLPTDGPAGPNLSHINIFLTLAPRSSTPGIKLDETRITPVAPQKHLAWYEWDNFLEHVVALLQRAKTKYPEVRDKVVFQESRIGADNLRGLAAAANALSNENANEEVTAPGLAPPAEGRQRPISHASLAVEPSTSPEPSPAHPDDAFSVAPSTSELKGHQVFDDTDAELKLLPHHVIKTIGPEGWRIISNAKEWYAMLLEMAFAIWADGVCNVLVELVDMPDQVAQGLEKNAARDNGKKRSKRVSLSGVVGMFK
ncbi:hypothetical protein BKA66DRAFT_5978 [Pyrenochaeta sp. MPI-SDFR-AT-0127]|nr:hypothetical protein BKA66DRAFT_5978 [Pyrenochaeta sp. MPI-SDFR-AT-0127]